MLECLCWLDKWYKAHSYSHWQPQISCSILEYGGRLFNAHLKLKALFINYSIYLKKTQKNI